ncbi:hypothetical protein M422DRAFT_273992 [Sphaerobolus stellatus SS14]|uniref:F-box domain-containing protein n=1 Tax=Sphaerobolus stellatus (strain SS14) TaxID=990650 RepID=A0A0C9U7K9_SPHS4|nr:hypothetical protein M422DRAFT_273992 [Sphaerobolus stellatus SS14]
MRVFHPNQTTWKLLYVVATVTMRIEEAQAKLHDLQLEKKNLEEHHYEATSLLVPIRRLPDEILGRVLLFGIPDVFKWNNPLHRIGTIDVLEDVDIESLYLARLYLLARSFTRLPSVETLPLHITQRSLQLSKVKLLDVYIAGRCRDKDAKWPPIADILSSSQPDENVLYALLNPSTSREHLKQLPTSTSPQWNNSLRPGQEISHLTMLNQCLPNIRQLSLNGLSFPPAYRFRNLTATFVFPKLEELFISAQPVLCSLLPCITMPELHTLSLKLDYSRLPRDALAPEITDNFARCDFPKLKALRFHSFSFKCADQLGFVLASFKRLQCLDFVNCTLLPTSFQGFLESGTILASLERITL